MPTLKQQIISALTFWSLFERGRNIQQLWQLTGASAEAIKSILTNLPNLKETNDIYHLDKLNQEHNQQHQHLVKKHLPFLRFLPGVRAVAVCNSGALGTDTQNSDIDLFIVLNKSTFFTSRLLITIYFQLIGHRRSNKQIRNRFCLSFFINDQDLNLTPALLKHDIYFYYWFRTLQWHLVPPEANWLEKFIEANHNWLHEFSNHHEFSQPNWQLKTRKGSIINMLIRILEPINRNWQLKRALKKYQELRKPAGVIINKSMLKFHVVDQRQSINNNFRSRLTKVLNIAKI